MQDLYKITVSPENVKRDLSIVSYDGTPVGVYSAMTAVVSSGPYGNSLLTNLTVPILLRQTAVDAGYYSPFDGAVLQKDVVANFIFSSTTTNPYVYNVYNTSNQFQKFLDLSAYKVDWGDGTPKEIITGYTPTSITHTYASANSEYIITMEQTNPWGVTRVSNVTIPFTVSGITKSRVNELAQYGSPKFQVGVPVIANGQIWGAISDINSVYTAYTITNVNYYDYSDGTTIFFQQSSGLTSNNLTSVPITKDEVLLKVIDQAQVQTDVFVERGKNSAYERVQRLGEVDNLGDMINYGYGFFNVDNKKRT